MAAEAVMPRNLLRSTLVFYPDRDKVSEHPKLLDKGLVSVIIIRLMPTSSMHDKELLEAALIGFQYKRDQLEQKIAELRSQIGGTSASRPAPAAAASGGAAPAKRKMSAAARRRIALAQKKRWAAYKVEHGTKAAAPKAKKRVISAEGRARIVAATKKRWAAYRKAQEAKKAS